jgi:hypothetical protein
VRLLLLKTVKQRTRTKHNKTTIITGKIFLIFISISSFYFNFEMPEYDFPSGAPIVFSVRFRGNKAALSVFLNKLNLSALPARPKLRQDLASYAGGHHRFKKRGFLRSD